MPLLMGADDAPRNRFNTAPVFPHAGFRKENQAPKNRFMPVGWTELLGRQNYSTGNRATVLIVEDELFVRMMAVDALEDAGYLTVEAQDADQALILLEVRKDIDLVFTDIKMPGEVDGLGLARRILERWPDIPVILTSGHLYREDTMMPPSVPFLQKPYRAATLIAEMGRMLG